MARSAAGLLRWVKANTTLLTLATLAASLLLWWLSLPGVKPQAMTDIGLLSVLPATYYLALLGVTASFCVQVFRPRPAAWVLPAHLGLIILMFHGTPAIVYGTLRYTWAWKHVGIVDYILRHHAIDPTLSFLTAYQDWPGFFALNALLVETAGLSTAAAYASWAPVFFNLLFASGVLFVLQSLTQERRILWLSAWFFVLTNWVGQDYFAPQALCYFLYLVFTGILLRWFLATSPLNRETLKRWLRYEPAVALAGRLLQPGPIAGKAVQPSPFQRTLLMAVAILLMLVITATHQLTPIMMISLLIVLLVFQQVVHPGLVALMVVIEAAWVFFMAAPFVGPNIHSVLASFGMVDGNITQNFINLSQVSPGQALVAWMGRGLTGLVCLLAGLGLVRRLRSGQVDLLAALLMVTPASLLVANSYGGEILFRVYFFALPFLAFFSALWLLPRPEGQASWKMPAALAGLSVVLITGFLFAYYGKDRQYYFTPQEVSAAQYLFDTAPKGSLIIEESGNYPSMFHNYEYYTHVPISLEPAAVRKRIIQNPAVVLSSWMSNPAYTAAYFIVTRSQKAEIEMEGELPPGAATKIEVAVAASSQFKLLYQNQDAAIYVLKGQVK